MPDKGKVEYLVGIQQNNERGAMGNKPSLEARFIKDTEKLDTIVSGLRALEQTIVLTSGTFDLAHPGHFKYLEAARECGNYLIVGVDSDEKVRARKGPDRPIESEDERVLRLAHLRSVDYIIIKQVDEPKWDLIKRVHPDTLVVTAETYSNETLDELSEFCGRIVCLEPQSTSSTSAKIRLIRIGMTKEIIEPINKIMEEHNVDPVVRRKIGKILLELSADDKPTQ